MRHSGSGGGSTALMGKSGQFVLTPGMTADSNDFNVSSQTQIAIQLSGTWTGTLYIYGSVDGENFVLWTLYDSTTGGEFAGATAPVIAYGNIAGLAKMRVSPVTLGLATVTWNWKTTI